MTEVWEKGIPGRETSECEDRGRSLPGSFAKTRRPVLAGAERVKEKVLDDEARERKGAVLCKVTASCAAICVHLTKF